MRLHCTAALILLASALTAHAAPITFTFSGLATGTASAPAATFQEAAFQFSGTTGTDLIVNTAFQ